MCNNNNFWKRLLNLSLLEVEVMSSLSDALKLSTAVFATCENADLSLSMQ